MVLVQGRCVYMYVWYSMWHTCTCMECAVSGLGECIVLDAYLQWHPWMVGHPKCDVLQEMHLPYWVPHHPHTSSPHLIPTPHLHTSSPHLIPTPHLHTSSPHLIPTPHPHTSSPHLIPTPHSHTSSPHLIPTPHLHTSGSSLTFSLYFSLDLFLLP